MPDYLTTIITMWEAGYYSYEEAVSLIECVHEEARTKALAFPIYEN